VAALAARLGVRVLVADLSAGGTPVDDVLRVIPREAWLRGCLLYVRGLERHSRSDGGDVFASLWNALDGTPTPFVVETGSQWPAGAGRPHGLIRAGFELPGTALREHCWRTALGASPGAAASTVAASLAARYRLSYRQIHESARAVLGLPRADGDAAGAESLAAAAREQTRHLLSGLAVHIEPRASWRDLVLPDDVVAQLRELCDQFARREAVLDRWGFRQKLASATGINALFAGPSGTGKTMAAEVIAGALGLDLYRIDLAAVVSKYIGETERNLERIFTAAENANAILFFDEADALFGRRSEVRDSHDRYANLEISYLLQRMERFEGIAILATNLRQNLDEAFVRRLAFVVNFPFPDEALRRRLWQVVWPASVPLGGDLDLDELARALKFSGGDIMNVARAAAFLAAGEGAPIGRDHVLHAAHREFQKAGRTVPALAAPGGSA
jgi:DNA polymerase III delta prime subunit